MSSQQPASQQPRTRQYFIGLGVGFIPLILAILSYGSSSVGILFSIALILYVAELIATIVLLIIEQVRFVGYGLLSLFLISPVVFFIACVVQLQQHPIL
jgi:hypothetical protein